MKYNFVLDDMNNPRKSISDDACSCSHAAWQMQAYKKQNERLDPVNSSMQILLPCIAPLQYPELVGLINPNPPRPQLPSIFLAPHPAISRSQVAIIYRAKMRRFALLSCCFWGYINRVRFNLRLLLVFVGVQIV
jgi:hypothetical protein